MTRRSESPKAKSCKSSPIRNHNRYLKPGALAKLRDSKIIAAASRHTSRTSHFSLSQLLSPSPSASPPTSPSSPSQYQQEVEQPLNQDNGVPCFAPSVNFINRPHCLRRKKLFAVTPVFTPTDTYQF